MNRLKVLRTSKNLRQEDIANYLSVAKSTYSYWESGKIEINNENLFRLADYFDVTIDYLLGRDEKKLDTFAGVELNEKQRAFMEMAQSLDDDQLDVLLAAMEALVRQKKKQN